MFYMPFCSLENADSKYIDVLYGLIYWSGDISSLENLVKNWSCDNPKSHYIFRTEFRIRDIFRINSTRSTKWYPYQWHL